MATQFKKRFTDGQDKFFIVEEVINTPAGLMVHYFNEKTQQKYSCLIDAFSQRFREVPND
jgi:hypothetical protein